MTLVDCFFCNVPMPFMSTEQCAEFSRVCGVQVDAGIFCRICGLHVVRSVCDVRCFRVEAPDVVEVLPFPALTSLQRP
jgi:hypothetical protein